MLFASSELATRIERAECTLLRDCAAAVAERRPDAAVLSSSLAGGHAAYTGPDSPLNKLAGLGFGEALDVEELASLEAQFAERCAPLTAEVSSLADPAIGTQLTERGYVMRGVENVYGLALPWASADALPSSDVRVVWGDDSDFESWLEAVVTGFASPDSQGVASHESYPREVIEPVIRDLCAGAGFLRFRAELGSATAGGGSMRVHEGIAQLTGAATLPEHRRRGVQSALLFHRLREASRLGCDVAVVVTQPGSKSAENVQRKGFTLLYTRAVLVREPS